MHELFGGTVQFSTKASVTAILDSQWHALFCIDHDQVKWRAKVFSLHCNLAYFGKSLSRRLVSHFFVLTTL